MIKNLLKELQRDEWPALITAGLVIGPSLILYFINFHDGLSVEHTRWAEFGSYVGGVWGAVFAFLAFIVLLRTLRVNQKELAETRDVLEKQNALLQQQSFEFTFFELLRMFKTEGQEINSHKYWRHGDFKRALKNNLGTPNILMGSYIDMKDVANLIHATDKEQPSLLKLKEWYEHLHAVNHVEIDAYVNSFVSVLAFIHDSRLTKTLKIKYLDLLISHTQYQGLLIVISHALTLSSYRDDIQQILFRLDISKYLKRKDPFSFWLETSIEEFSINKPIT